MTFREKSAWIVFLTVFAVFGVYYAALWPVLQSQLPEEVKLIASTGVMVVAVAALVVLQIVGHVVLAVVSPKSATAARDERERLIDLRASHLASPVLGIGLFISVAGVYFGLDRIGLAQAVLASLVIGTLAEYGAKIYFFRTAV